MHYQKQLDVIKNDPCVRNWAKDRLKELENRDPVDALHDCELLVAMCKLKLKQYSNA